MYQVLVVVSILLVASCKGQVPPFGNGLDKKCDFNPTMREKCGDDGISESECTAKGCCFTATSQLLPDIPQCYTHPGNCNVFPMDRVQCGSGSLTATSCKAMGCCYEEGLSGIPKCYNKE